jgi:gluconolactonase
MPLSPIPIESLRRIGLGLNRPEDVVVSRDNRVWASDQASACAEIRPDGTLRRVGKAGGLPNGINMDTRGRIVIANFGLRAGFGPLQRLDPETGKIEVLCSEIDGRPLVASNYPILDRAGNVWCSHSTFEPEWLSRDEPDGFVYRVRPDLTAEKMAEGFRFANGLAIDADESYLYVCQTMGRNVVRLRIRPDDSLGPMEPYGPVLGEPFVPNATPEHNSRFGLTDGCGFDQEGNLWVTLVTANKVVAITPTGAVETIIWDPTGDVMHHPTNLSWGGADLRDLYIGTIRRDYILQTRSPIPGLPLVHQQ